MIALEAELRNIDGVILLEDVPDKCSTNLRYKKCVEAKLRDLPNLFWVDNGCSAHILHKLITSTAGEEKLTGHVHAAQVVLSIAARRKVVWEAFWKIVDADLEMIEGEPPEEVAKHNAAIFRETFGRRELAIKA